MWNRHCARTHLAPNRTGTPDRTFLAGNLTQFVLVGVLRASCAVVVAVCVFVPSLRALHAFVLFLQFPAWESEESRGRNKDHSRADEDHERYFS